MDQLFQISMLGYDDVKRLSEQDNEPHVHDYEELLIGFELGFNEKSYFTNVFKKRTGQTPSDFRNEMKKLVS